MDEIKQTLQALMMKMDLMAENVNKISGLVEDVKKLNILLTQKDEKIAELEKRIDELEQYTRKEDVIINGLKSTPCVYSRVVRSRGQSGEDLSEGEQQTLENQVINFFQGIGISIRGETIAACHTLPKREGQKERSIILRFANRKHKTERLKPGWKLRDTQVYVNAYLTKRNAEIAQRARKLRKLKKIQGTWTRDCKNWIRTNTAPGEEEKVLIVWDLKDLEKYGTV